MLFNSLDYLLFLLASVTVYWTAERVYVAQQRRQVDASTNSAEEPRTLAARINAHGRDLRLLFIFLVSCVFYMAWNPAYIVLILFSTGLDFGLGLAIDRARSRTQKKLWLGLSLLGNLGLLGVFKYFNFFNQAVADVGGLFGASITPMTLDVLLPVGISFYTFQTMSYTIDIYRGKLKPTRNLIEFAFYVTFFPQLVAGPIVRAAEFLPQLQSPPWLTRERVSRAFFLIALGLTKKVVFADYISVNLVDRVFDDPAAFTATEVIVGLYGFTLQIYADFSGYTDVARGSALLFGLQLPENFDRPYQAQSVAEFWRRWHMTLSTWLRDYLYFPLGGSRHGPWRTYFNLWLVIFLIGLWHGASWTFVIYGNLQALAVMLTRAWTSFRKRRDARQSSSPYRGANSESSSPRSRTDALWAVGLRIFFTMQFVVFSRILFRATDLDNAQAIVTQLFSGTTSVAQVSTKVWLVLCVGMALHYTPKRYFAGVRERFLQATAWQQGLALSVTALLLAYFYTSEVVPYIYFQF